MNNAISLGKRYDRQGSIEQTSQAENSQSNNISSAKPTKQDYLCQQLGLEFNSYKTQLPKGSVVHMISVIFPSANNFYMAALSYSKYVGNPMSQVQSFEGPDTVISLKFGNISVRGKAPAVNRVS